MALVVSTASPAHRSGGPAQAPNRRAATPPSVSVVIATHDRVEQLGLCLDALGRQRPSPADFEVVVVDDASSDATAAFLACYRPPYALTVIRRRQARGRATARNAGWRRACGEVVVFMDADVLAAPTLVAEHRRLHEAWSDPGPLVVSGCPWCWRSALTVAFPAFSAEQRQRLRRLLAARPAMALRLPPAWDHGGRPVPLLRPDELADFDATMALLAVPASRPARAHFVAPSNAAPFLLFVTRDVSLRRETVADYGGFWEGFQRYGLADWEFGYRLYRGGATFVASAAASCVHQEHPTDAGRDRDNKANFRLFLARHPHAEVALMAVHPPWRNQRTYASLCRGWHRLVTLAPDIGAQLTPPLLAHARSWATARAAYAERLALTPAAAGAAQALQLWSAQRDPDAALLLQSLHDVQGR